MFRRTFPILACLAATLVSTSGCGRRSSAGPLVVSAIGARPAFVNPGVVPLDTASSLLMAATAQGLVRLDAAGQVEPGLAERWTVIDGGMTYIFRLREARWTDGKPVTATDVVTILKRQIGRHTRNPLAPFLTAIAEIKAMTPEVIEIDLARPRPDLLRLLAQPELGVFRMSPPGGSGPMTIAHWNAARSVILQPGYDPDRDIDDDDDAKPSPANSLILIGERAALAIVRFVEHQSDMVTGGTFSDWPLIAGSGVPPSSLHRDPAAGLFGLAIVNRTGFFADPANRAAVSEALDRDAALSSIAPDWPTATSILPNQLDAAAPPASPSWAALPIDARRADARKRVAAWKKAGNPPVVLRIALPDGPGATLLYGALGSDLIDIGISPQRVAPDAPADLRLTDLVAPTETARWYLATACAPCGDEAAAAIEAARTAPTPASRAQALTVADVALTNDAAFIPLGTPLRWSMVGPELDLWQANARAWHPLTELRSPPTS